MGAGLQRAADAARATRKPPIEDIRAGDAFREKMLGMADGTEGPYPWWHGWVIMEAFIAGIKYADEKRRDHERAKTAHCGS